MRKVIPAHHVAGIVMAVHAEDNTTLDQVHLICCHYWAAVWISFRPFTPCHPRNTFTESQSIGQFNMWMGTIMRRLTPNIDIA